MGTSQGSSVRSFAIPVGEAFARQLTRDYLRKKKALKVFFSIVSFRLVRKRLLKFLNSLFDTTCHFHVVLLTPEYRYVFCTYEDTWSTVVVRAHVSNRI